ERVRARVAAANPRGVPVQQGRSVFAEAGPLSSSPASCSLHSSGHPIFISRAKQTGRGAPKDRPAKRSAAGN
ncbi:hypothetical protein JG688_00017958, partial [Phytophthora aleatoria]